MSKDIKNNLFYFKISQENPEPHLDLNYFFLEKHPELPAYLRNVKEIKELLITIKKLKQAKESRQILEKYFQKLFTLFNKKFANCSELGCFVNACDTTRDLVKKDYKTFQTITNFFLEKRTFDEKAPENWTQAILDNNASRRKGECGELKLIAILQGFGFKQTENWQEFLQTKKAAAQFKGRFDMASVRKNLKVKIKTKKQGKKLDLLIRRRNRIFLLEAKHLNVSGGEQNKQIGELIEILGLKETSQNISYVAFLDGTYSNALLSKEKQSPKLKTQRQEITKFLAKNPKNFWLNTAGFQALFADLQ